MITCAYNQDVHYDYAQSTNFSAKGAAIGQE